MAAGSEKAHAGRPECDKASSAELEIGVTRALDAETNKKLLRKIDWRVMPVVSTSSSRPSDSH